MLKEKNPRLHLAMSSALPEPVSLKSSREVEVASTSCEGNFSQDCDTEEKTTEAVPETKFGDGKYNEKLDKYGCPANCDQIAVPTMNP